MHFVVNKIFRQRIEVSFVKLFFRKSRNKC